MEPLRVLIVDDSTLYRKIIKDAFSPLSMVEIVGMASNGRDALLRIASLKPDIVTLDMEMPGIDGIQVLTELQTSGFSGAVVVISGYTKKGTPLAIKSLELGAFEVILKPDYSSSMENMSALREKFLPMAEAIAQRNKIAMLLQGNTVLKPDSKPLAFQDLLSEKPETKKKVVRIKYTPEILVIGVSTGGPKALSEILPKFKADFKIPIVIVQHMPLEFTNEFANALNRKSCLAVKEAEDGDILLTGNVYVAPGGRQMKIVRAGLDRVIRVTDDPPVNNCKPSVDYCFESVANLYGGSSLALILTGMGKDGAHGSQILKNKGARVIVQDEETSVVFGMPKAVIDAGAADIVCPLGRIVTEIYRSL